MHSRPTRVRVDVVMVSRQPRLHRSAREGSEAAPPAALASIDRAFTVQPTPSSRESVNALGQQRRARRPKNRSSAISGAADSALRHRASSGARRRPARPTAPRPR
ncbi:hypothetical protein EVAR_35569_1 [Eumeta japonica]|uniref:Uncharacterized protein n=1 Tax=Eumeta variegata TaxID=151549 RepID=A0A4C1XM41_EUMVA|nr:hypothetical protein EVAR_35569_1 [Eumeta japonica]